MSQGKLLNRSCLILVSEKFEVNSEWEREKNGFYFVLLFVYGDDVSKKKKI